jgi:Fe-S-cluster containining protein
MGNRTPKECQRCGTCCQIHFSIYAEEEDIARWRAEGRTDILRLMEDEEVAWAGDQLVSTITGEPLSPCPFLQEDGTRFSCTIYRTRPRICREFRPGVDPCCPQSPRTVGPSVG